jgi:hypothetical protein
MMDDDECGAVGEMIGKRKPKYSEKTCPNAFLPTTNPICPDTELEPGPPLWEDATNRLSYGTVKIKIK